MTFSQRVKQINELFPLEVFLQCLKKPPKKKKKNQQPVQKLLENSLKYKTKHMPKKMKQNKGLSKARDVK